MEVLYKNSYKYYIIFILLNIFSCTNNTKRTKSSINCPKALKECLAQVAELETDIAELEKQIHTSLEPITDETDSSTTSRVQVKKKKGYLTVISDPTAAEIYIDNKRMANTPLHKFCIKSDTYKIKVLKKNYKTYETSISIVKDSTVSISVKLNKE